MTTNIINNFKKKRGRINDMQEKLSTHSNKNKNFIINQNNEKNFHEL